MSYAKLRSVCIVVALAEELLLVCGAGFSRHVLQWGKVGGHEQHAEHIHHDKARGVPEGVVQRHRRSVQTPKLAVDGSDCLE
eukprot:5900236-Prymnesium_polylepis.3